MAKKKEFIDVEEVIKETKKAQPKNPKKMVEVAWKSCKDANSPKPTATFLEVLWSFISFKKGRIVHFTTCLS